MRTRYIVIGVLVLFAVLLTLIVLRPHSAVAPGDDLEASPPEATSTLPVYTATTLAPYNGKNSDLPIYIAFEGNVYDVTSGKDFYGPGAMYHYLAGTDGTEILKYIGGDIIKRKYTIVGTLSTEETPSVPNSPHVRFGEAKTLSMNDVVTFSDGLELTLKEINDSRCAPDVQCIWAGELSVLFSIHEGAFGTRPVEVRLGTVNNQSVTKNGYTLTLTSGTPTEATVLVLKNTPETKDELSVGYVTGHVTISPICPIEDAAKPCEIPPEVYTSRNVVVYESNETTVQEKVTLDTKGNYLLTLPAGIYYIQIQPAGIGEGEKKQITVVSRKTQTLDFAIDSGIR